MTEIETQQSTKIDYQNNLMSSLNALGNSFKTWDGKDLDVVSKTSKDVLKFSENLYKETGNREFLLCHFVVQFSISMIFSRVMFAGAFNMSSAVPTETYALLGDELIKTGESVGKATFQSSLENILAFIYDNGLIPSI